MDLSFIIVEYHCLDKLRDCINSIHSNIQDLDYEIIISCNSNYSNEDREKLQKELPHTWIFNKKNWGYAKAVNIGIESSSGNYIFILNPDTQLMDNNIPKAIHYLEENLDIGILGPKVMDTKNVTQDSCRSFITPYMFVSRCIKRFTNKIESEILDNMDYNLIREVDWVSGACMLVKRNAAKKVGLMDERYFMYCEDMDWCKRFWENGLKVVYWPKIFIKHNASRNSSAALSKRILDKYAWIHFISYLKFFLKFYIIGSIIRKNRFN